MDTPNMSYETFFCQAFGYPPYDYQARLAVADELPSLVHVPTGAGKTNAILGAWLWRRLHSPSGVGRRLVYCLPMRTLVEQTSGEAQKAIDALEKAEMVKAGRFSVHVLLGGDVDNEWEAYPERESIIIGTQDMLLSRALNRGYGMSRYKWPVHFALLNNDCLWVFDEVQLFGDGLPTTTQLAAFREEFATFGAVRSLWMSATLNPDWLKSVDFAAQADDLQLLRLSAADQNSDSLKRKLNAVKVLQKSVCPQPADIAAFVKERHTAGTQTLVVLNTVNRAREVFVELEKVYGLHAKQKKQTGGLFEEHAAPPQIELIHSRFRPAERKRWSGLFKTEVEADGAGRIIVATQVVEAGVDISSKLLLTDLAPFSSLVQRFGRCNRQGEFVQAEIFWFDNGLSEKSVKPYVAQELTEAKEQLEKLASASLTDLAAFAESAAFKPQKFQPQHVLRRRDVIDLFDTTPDLSGFDLDISRFVRGGEERDAAVFWRENVAATIAEASAKDTKKAKSELQKQLAPSRDELCSVPIFGNDGLKGFLSDKVKGWAFDALEGLWKEVKADNLRAGITVLLDAADGGYDLKRGWDAKQKKEKVSLAEFDENATSESYDDEPMSLKPIRNQPYAQTLAAHSRETRLKLASILDALNADELATFQAELLNAAQHHDWGKAHKIFQQTLYGAESDDQLFDPLLAKAKSGRKHKRKKFRHELASALALLQEGASDLTIYLAACHHGKVRLAIRALPDETKPQDAEKKPLAVKYARGIWDADTLPATDLGDGLLKPKVTLDLEPMLLGRSASGAASWLERMIALRDRPELGVFRLAFLESLIRAADVQASIVPQDKLNETNRGATNA